MFRQKLNEEPKAMIMECETTFCKVYGEFQSIVTKLEAAAEGNVPIHEVEQTLVDDLRALGRSLLEAFIERQGDGDVGETVEHEEETLKRLADAMHERVEEACRKLVKDRMERTGMRWQPSGAQAVLDLRAVYLNGDWNEFHNERIRHEQNRLYPNRTQQITAQ